MMADKLRILYVDDEPSLLDIGKLFIERGGAFAVDTLTSATEALEQLKTERYDAIISDYQMPEMDGIAFLKQIKALGNKTPFIIFTGRGREEVVIEALNNGADFYIQKGGEPKSQFAELSHKIKTAVGRKQADDALNESERRLTDIVNFFPDATFAIDTSGYVIAWNKAIEEMTGVPARDMLGKGNYEYSVPFYGQRRPILIDLVSIPDEEFSRGKYVNIKKEGDILIAETSLPHPLGRYSVLMGKASLLYNSKGIVSGAIESIRDITEQKRMEETLFKKNEELNASYKQIAAGEEELRANLDELTRQKQTLRENEERYRQFFKTTLDSVFITTRDGQWVDCNDALVETFGYVSRKEVFDLPVTSFYAHPDQRDEFLKLVERDGYVKERPLQFKKKDGTVLYGLITIVPQKNPDGSIKEFIGTVHDITGKKRECAPHSMREPFNKNRVENLPDYILVYCQDGKILYINPSAAKALGYDADTVTGTPVLSYVAEESRENMAAKMVERNECGEIPIYEVELLAQDGGRKLVFVKGTQVLYDNKPATLLLLIDITLRKALENELTARAAELARISTAFQQANKKLMLLSSITRHDINNQLTVILGYLTLMENQQPDPVINDYFKKVITAANRISSMIQFTKEYEDIGISDPVWQDTRTIIDAAAKEAPLGKVIVKNDLPAGTQVFADPLIVKVCYNLMDNAVRYGAKITTIRFSVNQRDGDYVMVCEDDGDGVVAEEKERIFDRGFGKNTGLGLALSREILSLTGITICETGEQGKGARFEMVVPKGAYRFMGAEE